MPPLIPSKKFSGSRAASGLSLIETMVALGILLMILTAVSAFERNVFSLNAVLGSSLSGQRQLRRILKNFAAEARSASPSSLGAYPIALAESGAFTFYSDIDGDGLKERLRYFLDGVTLKRGILKPSGAPLVYNPAEEQVTTAADDVANGATPLFEYYDADYDGATPPLASPVDILAVRLVRVTVTVDPNGSKMPASFTLTTQVTMRNLKDNL